MRFTEDSEFILAGQKNDLKLETKIQRCWNEWLLQGCIILPAIQSRCKAWKFGQNTERREKGREKGWTWGWGKKKGRICAVVLAGTAISYLSPSVGSKGGCRPGAEGSSALLWGHHLTQGDPEGGLVGGAGHSWGAKLSLASSTSTCLPAP